MKYAALIFFVVYFAFTGYANEPAPQKKPTDEMGVGFSGTYSLLSYKWFATFHARYTRVVTPYKTMRVGLEYEAIFKEYTMSSILVPFELWPTNDLIIAIAPGVMFEKTSTIKFATRFEARYMFNVGKINLGPRATITLSKLENFTSFGIYAAVPF